MVREAKWKAIWSREWDTSPWKSSIRLLEQEEGIDCISDTIQAIGGNED